MSRAELREQGTFVRVKTCLSGESCKGRSTKDHLIPQAMAKRLDGLVLRGEVPRSAQRRVRGVVYNRSNIFPFCEGCHFEIDRFKVRSLIANPTEPLEDNPAAMFKFFREDRYPITDDPKLKPVQLLLMFQTYYNFVDTATSFVDDLPNPLKRRYKRAIDWAADCTEIIWLKGRESGIYLTV
jgi:hypothetical protein